MPRRFESRCLVKQGVGYQRRPNDPQQSEGQHEMNRSQARRWLTSRAAPQEDYADRGSDEKPVGSEDPWNAELLPVSRERGQETPMVRSSAGWIVSATYTPAGTAIATSGAAATRLRVSMLSAIDAAAAHATTTVRTGGVLSQVSRASMMAKLIREVREPTARAAATPMTPPARRPKRMAIWATWVRSLGALVAGERDTACRDVVALSAC